MVERHVEAAGQVTREKLNRAGNGGQGATASPAFAATLAFWNL
jgi:hypothetical protein